MFKEKNIEILDSILNTRPQLVKIMTYIKTHELLYVSKVCNPEILKCHAGGFLKPVTTSTV